LISKAAVREIKNIVGQTNVLEKEAELLTYAYDNSFHQHKPDLVVLPSKEEEVSAIVKLANEAEVPLVPRGAGTGQTAGSVPLKGGIVLSTTRMDGYIEVDKENLIAKVPVGVVNWDLQKEVEKAGLFFPPDPSSLKTATIGGNLAENAGGPRGFKYGVTRDYALGMNVVTPAGKVLKLGGQTIKNVTAYDLCRLVIGSEGTLGVITQANLRLIPQPEERRTLMAIYKDIERAGDAVSGIIAKGIVPAAIELIDDVAIRCIEETLKLGLPTDADAILLIEIDGFKVAVDYQMEQVEQVCKSYGADRISVARNEKESEQLWVARRAFAPAVLKLNPTKVGEDATVPRSRLTEFIKGVKKIAGKYQLELALCGHAGDGNMHPNFMVNARDKDEMKRLQKAVDELFALTLDLGGTLSGEHGIGSTKAQYLNKELNQDTIDAMQAIKDAWDPKGFMNPMKIFPRDTKTLSFLG